MRQNLPKHIAIIPDGNRRWARSRGLPPWEGHRYGAKTLEKIASEVLRQKIPYFSFWAASVDNLKKRSPQEIKFLLQLFKEMFTKIAESKEIHENEVRVDILGRWRELLPKFVQRPMQKALDATRHYSRFFLNFLIAYSGTDEMLSAIKGIVKDMRENHLRLTPKVIKKHLYTKDLPSVDLVIRTGGEPHLSAGFLMWDVADAQLYFSKKMWPAFTPADLRKALQDYAGRKRRFGA